MAVGRSVAIVDGDSVVRQSVASLLIRTGFEVAEFESGDQFLARLVSELFSCVLLDLHMPWSDGLAVLRALADRAEVPPVLVIIAYGGIAAAVDAMKLGALDFLEKPYAPDDLLAAIRKALTTDFGRQAAAILRSEAAARLEALSQRQQQVLRGILKGQPNRVIAYDLGISARTVEAYRAELFDRLGVRGTAEAARLAIAAGMA
jgi:two-component system response regulator FixJ